MFRLIPAALLVTLLAAAGAGGAAAPTAPQGTQSDASFAASYAAAGVTSVSATTQRVSCYRPELLAPVGNQACPGATTGESPGPYATQDAAGAANPVLFVRGHSESDLRVDPLNPQHLIGQSKWFVSPEGYNHLLGFYESWDGGRTWPAQGHVPGYEGWTDNTDPVGAFDPWGNFYSLVLAYQFAYDKNGGHVYNNGSNQTNPSVPPETVAVAVRPHGATGANDWITTHAGHPDYVMTASNAATNDPDKQWIAIDTNPSSRCYRTIYAMYTVFVLDPSKVFVSTATANADGTHSDWSAPQELPTQSGHPWDSYLLPHVTPDGTVYTPITNNPQKQDYSHADISLDSSSDCGRTWRGPTPVTSGIAVPTYQNTTFREGIVDSFAVGSKKVGGAYPLYSVWEDGSSGVSNLWLSASYDRGASWSAPILVNDNAAAVDELQPNLTVDAASGTVAVGFYDRRLPCANGAANWCVNTAVQLYDARLRPLGHNVRVSPQTWDPQLNAPHPGCPTCSTTFIGDYFGIDSTGSAIVTSSVSTADLAGENPAHEQQQVVARLPLP